jgi:hypothetical protein
MSDLEAATGGAVITESVAPLNRRPGCRAMAYWPSAKGLRCKLIGTFAMTSEIQSFVFCLRLDPKRRKESEYFT